MSIVCMLCGKMFCKCGEFARAVRLPGYSPEAPILSTKIKILVDEEVIGEIQSINVDDTDSGVTMADEPEHSPITVTAGRVRFDKKRMSEAFARGLVGVKSQCEPMQIIVRDRVGEECIDTNIKNCWVSSISSAITTADYIIAENVNFIAEEIYSKPLTKIRQNIYDQMIKTIQKEQDKIYLSMVVKDSRNSINWNGFSNIDWGKGNSETVISTVNITDVSNVTGGELTIRAGCGTTTGGDLVLRPGSGAALDNIAVDGVTCKNCNDYNEYCNSPSESDGTHICYKCRNGY